MLFLIDEMFPPTTCDRLVRRGHDAIHVRDRGVNAQPDREIARLAALEDRVLVAENIKDFAHERDIVVVCVQKGRLPAEGMAEHLAELLDDWASLNPEPYVGMHWPKARS